jgi:hypothetical protein
MGLGIPASPLDFGLQVFLRHNPGRLFVVNNNVTPTKQPPLGVRVILLAEMV